MNATVGYGQVQREIDPIEEIRLGDVVWCPPDAKHWHGASPITMRYIAILAALNGKVVEWLEQISDWQCCANCGSRILGQPKETG